MRRDRPPSVLQLHVDDVQRLAECARLLALGAVVVGLDLQARAFTELPCDLAQNVLPARASPSRSRLLGGGGESITVQRERSERRAAVERAVDVVRERFGLRAVGPATLVEPDQPVGE